MARWMAACVRRTGGAGWRVAITLLAALPLALGARVDRSPPRSRLMRTSGAGATLLVAGVLGQTTGSARRVHRHHRVRRDARRIAAARSTTRTPTPLAALGPPLPLGGLPLRRVLDAMSGTADAPRRRLRGRRILLCAPSPPSDSGHRLRLLLSTVRYGGSAKREGRATREVEATRTAFLWRAMMYDIFSSIVPESLSIREDSARVEDSARAIVAVAAAPGSSRETIRACGLYALNKAVTAIIAVVVVAPGAGGAGSDVLTVLVTQVYIAARLAMKLQFMASETALFQSRLAHARYTAAPEPAWPESPAAEAIGVRPQR